MKRTTIIYPNESSVLVDTSAVIITIFSVNSSIAMHMNP
jgi:hypothetical protein